MQGTDIDTSQLMGRVVKALEMNDALLQTFAWPAEFLLFAFDRVLLAGATVNDQAVDMSFDFNFLVYGIGLTSDHVFTWQLKTTGTSVFFSNSQVRSDCLWTVQNPILWFRRPTKVMAKSSLKIDLRNLDLANPTTLQIVFIGWKEMPS